MARKRNWNIFMIIIAVLLIIGTVVVCIVGQKRFKWPEKKDYTGAREVNSFNLDYEPVYLDK